MINIKSLAVKPYEFLDGSKKVVTKNPSQSMFIELQSVKDLKQEDYISWLDARFSDMLKEDDKHYCDEVSLDVKIALVTDYIDYHCKVLEERFPSTNS